MFEPPDVQHFANDVPFFLHTPLMWTEAVQAAVFGNRCYPIWTTRLIMNMVEQMWRKLCQGEVSK